MNDPSASLLRVDEARARLLDAVAADERENTVPLRDALGRVLARDAAAAAPVPPADNSAMDGYACRSSDLDGSETVLSVSDRILAGRAPAPLQPGTAARIMTGAVVPEGADMVVMQEHCEADGERVRIRAGAAPGTNIRRAGEELAPGQVVLGAGRRMLPEDLGLLATIGLGEIAVRPRLRVFVLASGDELIEPGRPLAPGQIYNSNAVMLAALVRMLGCEPIVADRVSDTPEATEAALRSAVEQADLVLTSGGVSVGDADWVRKTIERLGRLEVWKVAVKPGKPLAFGLVDGVPILGLPGNPVASHVGFCLFAAPMIRAMLGIEESFPAPESWPSAFECASGSREVYWRVRPVDGALHPFPHQGSAALSSLSWATGLARVPADRPISVGDRLEYFPFSALLA